MYAYTVLIETLLIVLGFIGVTSATLTVLHIQLEVLREHRPLPNASIMELLNDFCNAN